MSLDVSPLFTPFEVRNLRLPNRFVMPAMQRGWCDNGRPTQKMADYYRRRVQGGVSLVIGESSAVDHPAATQQPSAAFIFGDALAGWERCVRAVHAEGGQMLIQLWHEGGVRKEGGGGLHPEAPSLSPSGLVQKGKPNGRPATLEDLQSLKDSFVRGALAAQSIGADGVEVHAAHGYCLDLFLWAETNLREDGYGGPDMAARARLPAEIVAAIRAAVGPDFAISIRFSQWKEVDYSARIAHGPEELATFVRLVSDAGADLIHASARRFHVPEWPGSDLGIAGWVKRFTNSAVITVGSVGLDRDIMANVFGETAQPSGEEGIAELLRRFVAGEFDLVSVGRCSISDPDFVAKLQAGRFDAFKPFTREDMISDIAWEMGFVEDAQGAKAAFSK